MAAGWFPQSPVPILPEYVPPRKPRLEVCLSGDVQGGVGRARDQYCAKVPLSVIWQESNYVVCIGSFDTVKDWRLLDKNNIGIVINTARSVDYKRNRKIQYLNVLDMNDTCEYNRVSDLVACLKDFDEKCWLSRRNGLIHCAKGANRSGAFACAYIVAKTGVSVNQAYDFLRDVRTIVDLGTCREGYSVRPLAWLQRIEADLHKIFKEKGFSVWISKTNA